MATAAQTVRGSDSRNGSGGSRPGGIRGLIERRAANWTLDGPNERFVTRQAPVWNFLMDHYFRMEVRGWHRLPPPPALLIGIHAGGILPIDAYTFGFAWFREIGLGRPMHGTAHDFLMATPGIGDYLRNMGTIPASRRGITAALGAGHDVMLWPGGDVDALRPWSRRDEVVLGNRSGFVRQAIKLRVPIVPVATTGGADTLIVLTDGRRIARLLNLKKVLRSEVFPIALGFPLGIAPGVIPQIPLPAKIRTEILEPVEMGEDPDLAHDEEYVVLKREEVVARLKAGVTALAQRRSFPILG